MEQNSFIKLWRSLKNWEWYTDSNVKCLWLHCLLSANWEDKQWRGIVIKRGQFITSLDKLSSELSITKQSIRTALNSLKSTQEITCESTNRFTLITVVKYNDFQSFENEINTLTNTQTNIQVTNNQQTTNKQLTPTKELKNIRNKELKNKKIYGEFQNVKLSDEDYKKLDDSGLLPYIERLSGYIASKGDKYKDHYATIKQWVARDEKEGKREITSRPATNNSGTRPDEKYTVGPDGIRRDRFGLEIL